MTNADQPAFPVGVAQAFVGTGLTKLELLSAIELQGIIAAFGRGVPAPWDKSMDQNGDDSTHGIIYAKAAIGYAEALLAELEKKTT